MYMIGHRFIALYGTVITSFKLEITLERQKMGLNALF